MNIFKNLVESIFAGSRSRVTSTLPEASPQRELTPLEAFMEFDYFQKGEQDGFEYHATSVFDNYKNSICANFRILLSQEIDMYRAQVTIIRNLVAESRDLDARREETNENNVNALLEKIAEYEMQKALSVDYEGKVAGPIRKYHDGFIRGLQRYQTQAQFAASTGVFFPTVKH